MSDITISSVLTPETGVIHTNFSSGDLATLLGMCSHIVYTIWKNSDQSTSLEDMCKHVFFVAEDYSTPADASFN